MSLESPQPVVPQSPSPRRRFARRFDWPLLLAALLVVLLEDVLWAGAKALLHATVRLCGLHRLHAWLGRLPPGVAVTLFLIPEAASHLGSLAAAVMLVEWGWTPAAIFYVATKLIATGLAVWIYSACEPSLLTVAWFARAHGWVMAKRAIIIARMLPLRRAIRRRLRLPPLPG